MVKKIIWFTGLSGSGKTTIANLLNLYLRKLNFKVKIIDGDIFRNKTKNFKFTRNSIVENNLKIIDFVKNIYSQYDFIIVSAISPLVATRSSAKKIFKKKYY